MALILLIAVCCVAVTSGLAGLLKPIGPPPPLDLPQRTIPRRFSTESRRPSHQWPGIHGFPSRTSGSAKVHLHFCAQAGAFAGKDLRLYSDPQRVSVVLLVATLAIMTIQMARIKGGHLLQRAPKSLPPGVLALDGWRDRLSGEICARATRSFVQSAGERPRSPGPASKNSSDGTRLEGHSHIQLNDAAGQRHAQE
jgi:hypothetical protein